VWLVVLFFLLLGVFGGGGGGLLQSELMNSLQCVLRLDIANGPFTPFPFYV